MMAYSPSSLDLPMMAHTAVGPQDAAIVGTSRQGAVGTMPAARHVGAVRSVIPTHRVGGSDDAGPQLSM